MMDLRTVRAFQRALEGNDFLTALYEQPGPNGSHLLTVQSSRSPILYTITLREMPVCRTSAGGLHTQCDCDAGRRGQPCRHQAAAIIAWSSGMITKKENANV